MSQQGPPPNTGSGAAVDGRRVIARVRRRFLPFVFICYVVAYLDRVAYERELVLPSHPVNVAKAPGPNVARGSAGPNVAPELQLR